MGESMNFGARNQLEGKVVDIKKGDVMCQVTVKIDGTKDAHVSSVMTMDSLADLKLKVGDSVRVIAKAVNVMLAK